MGRRKHPNFSARPALRQLQREHGQGIPLKDDHGSPRCGGRFDEIETLSLRENETSLCNTPHSEALGNRTMLSTHEPAVELLDLVPELPKQGERWTTRRKATLVQAVRGGWVPIEEVCATYNISVDEFIAWEQHMDRFGVPGLRTTRFQIYRDAGITKAAAR